jgi:hypothetical protein
MPDPGSRGQNAPDPGFAILEMTTLKREIVVDKRRARRARNTTETATVRENKTKFVILKFAPRLFENLTDDTIL